MSRQPIENEDCEGLTPAEVLSRVYALCADGWPRGANHILTFAIDYRMAAGLWADIAEILRTTDLSKMADLCVVGLLSATFPGRDKVDGRAEYAERARVELGRRIGVGRADELIGGLR